MVLMRYEATLETLHRKKAKKKKKENEIWINTVNIEL
jgi:hypothetical protein